MAPRRSPRIAEKQKGLRFQRFHDDFMSRTANIKQAHQNYSRLCESLLDSLANDYREECKSPVVVEEMKNLCKAFIRTPATTAVWLFATELLAILNGERD